MVNLHRTKVRGYEKCEVVYSIVIVCAMGVWDLYPVSAVVHIHVHVHVCIPECGNRVFNYTY